MTDLVKTVPTSYTSRLVRTVHMSRDITFAFLAVALVIGATSLACLLASVLP